MCRRAPDHLNQTINPVELMPQGSRNRWYMEGALLGLVSPVFSMSPVALTRSKVSTHISLLVEVDSSKLKWGLIHFIAGIMLRKERTR